MGQLENLHLNFGALFSFFSFPILGLSGPPCFCPTIPLSLCPPYDSCPSINSSVVKLMDATEIPRKSSCLLAEPDRPLFAPLSSRMELFHRPNTAFYTFREREPLRIKEGASERIADIDCSRAERSRAKQSLINRRHRHQIRGRRPLLLFLDRSDRRSLLYGSLLPDAVLPFSDRKERERERRGTAAWQPRPLKFSRYRGAI